MKLSDLIKMLQAFRSRTAAFPACYIRTARCHYDIPRHTLMPWASGRQDWQSRS